MSKDCNPLGLPSVVFERLESLAVAVHTIQQSFFRVDTSVFLGVPKTIIGSLVVYGIGIVQCLYNLLHCVVC